MTRTIGEMIEAVVRERLPDAGVEKVTVAEERDYEGDAVYRVTVIFNHKGPLDSRRTAGLTRHIRHKLLAAKEDAFPIFAFVSKTDAAGLKPAAA